MPFIPPTTLEFASLRFFGSVSPTNSQPHAVARFIADLKDEGSDMVKRFRLLAGYCVGLFVFLVVFLQTGKLVGLDCTGAAK